MKLADIPVRTEAPGGDATIGAGVTALLHEIAGLLGRLAAEGTSHAIDLRSLPMGPQDHARLSEALGQGEVTATLEADGVTVVRETALAGVWWVEHRNRAGQVIAELIEVTRIPDILVTPAAAAARSERALRERLASS